jgi:hypothetical protein
MKKNFVNKIKEESFFEKEEKKFQNDLKKGIHRHGKAKIEIEHYDESVISLVTISIVFIQLCNQEIEKWKAKNKGTYSLEYWEQLRESHLYGIKKTLITYNIDLPENVTSRYTSEIKGIHPIDYWQKTKKAKRKAEKEIEIYLQKKIEELDLYF